MKNHLKNILGMKKRLGALTCFTKTTRGKLPGLVGAYVDNMVAAGNENFKEKIILKEENILL